MSSTREPPVKPPQPEKPSGSLATAPAVTVTDNGSRLASQADRPPGLRGAVLPGRDRNIRKKAMRLFWEHSHLALGDWRAAYRYVQLADRLIPNLLRDLHERGLFTQGSGDPRKANDALVRYMGEARAHERDLGLTAGARAALGLTVGRMKDLASAMSQGGRDDGD